MTILILSKRAVAWKRENGQWIKTKRPGRKVTLVTNPDLKSRYRQQQIDLESLRVQCDDQNACVVDSDAESW